MPLTKQGPILSAQESLPAGLQLMKLCQCILSEGEEEEEGMTYLLV
jgi:hypothetical protein